MNRIAKNIVRFRWPIIVGFVATALFFGSRIPRSEIECLCRAGDQTGFFARAERQAHQLAACHRHVVTRAVLPFQRDGHHLRTVFHRTQWGHHRAEQNESLPDPGKIWIEAELRSRRFALERATRPITVMRRVALAGGAVVATGVGISLAPVLGRWLGRLQPPSLDTVSAFAFFNGILLIVASGGFLALAAYAVISSLRES